MKRQEATLKQKPRPESRRTALGRSGLQFRMTASYALTTLAAVLAVEVVLFTTLLVALAYGPLEDSENLSAARDLAEEYALAAAAQAGGADLDPNTTFEPGRASSIAMSDATADPSQTNPSRTINYVASAHADAGSVAFALLVAPGGRVLASSFPSHYPAGTLAARLLPNRSDTIEGALAGVPRSSADNSPQGGRIAYAAETVWSRDKKPVGAVYVEVPGLSGVGLLQGFSVAWLVSGLLWLLIMLPVGALFGLITTRGLVRRLQRLVTATTRFAEGDYTHRVQVSRPDEVGQLEEQFNRMAEQFVQSINQRQALAGENARLAERSRIARDLHDSVKQQAFAVAMQLGAAKAQMAQDQALALQHLAEAEDLAYNVQQELATMIQELRPLALQDKPLSSALREYVTAWSRQHGITADVDVPDLGALAPAVEEALWRVAQEALSNTARHGQATGVWVSLARERDGVILSVVDDGRGFDAAATGGSGVGLYSMRERMEAVGGTITVESEAGKGTRVVAQVPDIESQLAASGEQAVERVDGPRDGALPRERVVVEGS